LKRAVSLTAAAVLLATSCAPFSATPTSVTLNVKNRQLEVPTGQQLTITFSQPVESPLKG